jgi:hypothetical protein
VLGSLTDAAVLARGELVEDDVRDGDVVGVLHVALTGSGGFLESEAAWGGLGEGVETFWV